MWLRRLTDKDVFALVSTPKNLIARAVLSSCKLLRVDGHAPTSDLAEDVIRRWWAELVGGRECRTTGQRLRGLLCRRQC